MPIEEFPITQSGGTRVPHSVAIGPNRWLWVTTDNKSLVQISRSDPSAQTVFTDLIPTYSAGILKDPKDRKVVWFASPAGPQDYDPIYEFDVEELRIINKHNLQDDARAQTIATVRIKTDPNNPSAPKKDYILFAEPVYTSVGYVEVGKNGASFHALPKEEPGFNTWLWSVTATVDPTETKFTYWATGQQHDRPARTTNGLYTFTPADDNAAWRRIPMPGGQIPIHIIAGDVTEDGEKKTYLWISARNPNRILRYDVKDKSWKQSQEITGEPRQLAFGPDNLIWVAGSDKIYRFRKNDAITLVPSPSLPPGSEANAICIDDRDKVVWYTNRPAKKIGKYPIPEDGKSVLGKTQLVVQPTTSVAPGDIAEVPLVASFVAGANAIPGIPLTCRITSEETTFLDGTRECVIETDVTGEVTFPAVHAGKVEEEAVLKIGWGDNEPPTTVILNVRNEPEDNGA
ncbi:hypothetical protein [Streptomyces luteireticuli]|uniref:hypothetical protein n=1 Tax=Streptomyces luteireticuli TaxID=173858 RepID=UPI003558CDBE